ncbi:hypothetical protein SS50377_23822 [Spironucleus salmonicida]|uniref:Uncharacterized protein n=1 Tax=Spironucleus salmonicida TaxID=348837 RepID=V6LS30_9EUKA|nr:hypothetical protein SS50377_23822 [Spironucleus salmonicida]|eukprot:EST46501.1 Hypothetical protein SS50377_13582 [Spironucleus salmonicida]
MSQMAYLIDNSPTSRDILTNNQALEAFKLHFLETVNKEIVDNREAAISLVSLNQRPSLLCPLINRRFPLQEASRNFTFAPQFDFAGLAQKQLFDGLKLCQMALNQRTNKQVKPRITALICTEINFQDFEKECKILKKEGVEIRFLIGLLAKNQYDFYAQICEKIGENCSVSLVENETFLVIKNQQVDDDDEELQAVLALSRNEFLAQQGAGQ